MTLKLDHTKIVALKDQYGYYTAKDIVIKQTMLDNAAAAETVDELRAVVLDLIELTLKGLAPCNW